MIVQVKEDKKTALLLILSILLFTIVIYFFIDFSKSIESGIKRFFDNVNIEYKYSTYNETLEQNKKQYLIKKEKEEKLILEQLKKDDYFEFKILRFEKNSI